MSERKFCDKVLDIMPKEILCITVLPYLLFLEAKKEFKQRTRKISYV